MSVFVCTLYVELNVLSLATRMRLWLALRDSCCWCDCACAADNAQRVCLVFCVCTHMLTHSHKQLRAIGKSSGSLSLCRSIRRRRRSFFLCFTRHAVDQKNVCRRRAAAHNKHMFMLALACRRAGTYARRKHMIFVWLRCVR